MKVKVFLNQEGKKLWGDVFPSGEVPVTSMTFSESNLGRVILVAWKALTALERELIVEKISNLSNVPKDIILKDIETKHQSRGNKWHHFQNYGGFRVAV